MPKIYLPYDEWPVSDCEAWQKAIADGDVLDGRGPAAHWRETTRRTNIEHYGRWLAFLVAQDVDIHGLAPAARVTPETMRVYISALEERLAPRTVVSSLVGLKVMMKAMASDQNWRWLEDVCNRLNVRNTQVRDKRPRMRSTIEIVRFAYQELERLQRTPLTRRIERVAFRDTLMIGLMAARPLRLGNFTSLDIGGRFRRNGEGWIIDLPGAETKNKDPLTFNVPADLMPLFDIYLDRVRPAFLCKADADISALWLTYQGTALTDHAIYCRIVYVTKKWFGISINPHLFRDCAATTMSSVSVEDALASAALLGHRNFATTEKYYIRANQLDASRRITHCPSSEHLGQLSV